jgi:hypothetical protein
MKRLLASLLVANSALHAVDLTLTSPLDYQVVQRSSPGRGLLRITGELSEDVPADAAVQVRVMSDGLQLPWTQVNSVKGRKVIASYEAPAGGWWKVEVRVSQGGKQLALGSVAHLGIGEVFVIAGQSNSANHGQEKQTTKTRRVASFDGKAWRIAQARMLLPAGATPVATAAKLATVRTLHEDQAAVKSCPHCGSERLCVVDIYTHAHQVLEIFSSPNCISLCAVE